MSQTNRLVRIFTLRCEEASELLSRELDESLGFLDRAALYCHLMVCLSCRRFRMQIHLIHEAIRVRDQRLTVAESDGDGLSPEAKARIALACRQFDREDAGDDTPHG